MDDGKEEKKVLLETAKKLFSTGLTAAFMTEETLRHYLHDMKLPKEVLNKMVESANKSKGELLDRVGDEVVGIIKKIDFVKEASRFVEDHKFKVSAEIEVIRTKDRAKES